MSRLMMFYSESAEMSYRDPGLRRAFSDLPYQATKVHEAHSHPQAAGDRNAFVAFSEQYGRSTGLVPYHIQMSAADQRAGRLGSRSYFWAKDLTMDPISKQFPGYGFRVLTDVDYYLDMPRLLTNKPRPTMLYTLTPEAVAQDKGEAVFTFDETNVLRMLVSGGASYTHEVWNYGHDSLMVHGPKRSVAFLVERRTVASNRSVILLLPIASWDGFYAWVFPDLLGPRLKRLQVHHGGYLRLQVQRKDGMAVSTGKPGMYSSVTIPVAMDDQLAIMAATSTVSLSVHAVLSVAGNALGDDENKQLLVQYHRSRVGCKPDTVFPVSNSVMTYQMLQSGYTHEPKQSLVPFMAPIVPMCYTPAVTVGNERHAVLKRVVEIAADPELVIPPKFAEIMDEFLDYLFPDPYVLDPVDVDHIYEAQNRPAQRRLLEEGCSYPRPASQVVKTFQKKEAYANGNDPRIISTINPFDKVGWSEFMHALAIYIKRFPWYAFGKTPKEIARRVAEVAQRALEILESDCSRMDGRVSTLVREFERRLIIRGFRRCHHARGMELHQSQFNKVARGAQGTTYDTGTTRLSGSAETSIFNTLLNTLIAYLALRTNRTADGFLSPVEAQSRLGAYGGDDGITADVSQRQFQYAAQCLGQKATGDQRARGSHVKFLARYYSRQVWFGCPDSCSDIRRQMSKFHTTVNLPVGVTKAQKAFEKASAYSLTDANTPIIGDLSFSISRRFYGDKMSDDNARQVRSWWANYQGPDQYPNMNEGAWMEEIVTLQLPTFDFDRFRAWCRDGPHELEAFIACAPVCIEPPPPEAVSPAVVGDELAGGAKPRDVATASKIERVTARSRKFAETRKLTSDVTEEAKGKSPKGSAKPKAVSKPPSPKAAAPKQVLAAVPKKTAAKASSSAPAPRSGV